MLADFIVAPHSQTPVPLSKGAVSRELGRVLPSSGHGYLSGSFPDGITKVEGVPTPLEVRVIYRPESGSSGDGVLVAKTMSSQDGTWLVEGLDHNLKYDVICRHEGYNDMILSNVSPALATGLQFAGSFMSLNDQVEILLGTGPYQVDVVDGTPPIGVTFAAQGNFIVATGAPGNWEQFTFTLRVIDSTGLSGVFESVMEVVEPLPEVIGEPWGGGFYAGEIQYSDGQWYKLIVADKSTEVFGRRWNNANAATPGTDSEYDGFANTLAMVAEGVPAHPAAAYCASHAGGGFNDWYMPSIGELNTLYLSLGPQLPTSPNDFKAGGSQAFAYMIYWSSTQSASTTANAKGFNNGSVYTAAKAATDVAVRPIRRLPFTP